MRLHGTTNSRLLTDRDDLSLYQPTKSPKKKHKSKPSFASAPDSNTYDDEGKANLIANAFLKSHQISDVDACHPLGFKLLKTASTHHPTDFPHRVRASENKSHPTSKSKKSLRL